MPPEGPGGVSADLYSLGKVLYEASMGRDRLDFPALASDLEALGLEQGPLLRGLNHVLLRACDPRPERRYGSASLMGADLRRLREGRPLHTSRRWQLSSTVLLLVVLAGVLLATMRWHDHRASIQAPAPNPAAVAIEPTPTRVALPQPTTGAVRLESEPPGATVRLGERELGVSPLTITDLLPGRVTFVFSHPGFHRRTQETSITAGETATVRAVLPPGRAVRPDVPWENRLGMRFLPLDGGAQMSQ